VADPDKHVYEDGHDALLVGVAGLVAPDHLIDIWIGGRQQSFQDLVRSSAAYMKKRSFYFVIGEFILDNRTVFCLSAALGDPNYFLVWENRPPEIPFCTAFSYVRTFTLFYSLLALSCLLATTLLQNQVWGGVSVVLEDKKDPN
jgi:hypothetical protein